MSAPEPKPESATDSKIVSIAPQVLAESQRSLAAIVFTDTVDFSALMSKDEDQTRRLISRDLGSMRLACAKFDGEVLKSTGDGLLMLFTSAVQAVSCALEIQARFREQNRVLPLAERLRHRIGIHLGDVIRQHDDVMGDGVNIAARLQGEGAPGGVCISSTVFEVVQNRVPFYVVSRKARKLKNVGNVLIYQISQREGGFRYLNQAWDWLLFKRKRLIRIALVFLVLGVVLFFTTNVEHPFHDKLVKMAPTLNPMGPQIGVRTSDDDDDGEDPRPAALPARAAAPGLTAATDEDFYVARFADMKGYDFAAMHTWLEKHDSPDVDEEKLEQVLTSLQNLFTWSFSQFPAYSSSRPLLVRLQDQDFESWPAPDGGITWKGRQDPFVMARAEVPPALMAEIISQLIRDNAKPRSTESIQLWRSLEYFDAAYGLRVPHRLQKEMDSGSRRIGARWYEW